MKDTPTVRAVDLLVRIHGQDILRGVTFEVDRGVTAVVGPNGAGKSTLIRSIATLLPPSGGALFLNGLDLSSPRAAARARRLLGYLPQEPNWLPQFNVAEAVSYGAWLHGIERSRRAEAVDSILRELDLDSWATHRLSALSGGTRRRAYIAQALVHRPPILVMDEPTSGLDTEHRVELRELIRSLASERLVLLTTHMTEDIELLPSRILVLREGTIQFDGTPEGLAELGRDANLSTERAVERGLRELGGLA